MGFAKIYALSVGTTPKKIEQNQGRVGVFIQNLSVNNLYVLTSGEDTAQGAKIEPNKHYVDEQKSSQGALILLADGASSDIRVVESIG